MIPLWLHVAAVMSLAAGAASALLIAADEYRHPQKMWIMNLVWPVCALFGSGVLLWFYIANGRRERSGGTFREAVAKATLHCGAGCTLGDIAAETAVFAVPAIAVWFGWHSLFAERTFAVWLLDYLLAFALGIVFQYFTIAPMRGLGPGAGIAAAVKADALSLTAWQVGMYGAMALVQFAWAPAVLGRRLTAAEPEFWLAMQIAMLAGFVTSYPANRLLLRTGLKERM